MLQSTLWILTEERPKTTTIGYILYRFCKDQHLACFIDTLRIIPLLNDDRTFSFVYELIGFRCPAIKKILLKIVSGYSSFVDYLVFYQENEPDSNDIPIYAIEETKTDDSESRNTGVYQRASKFVFINYYYPKIRKIMYYDLKIPQKKIPTLTYVFGTRCLMTLGVEIVGKKLNGDVFKPFQSIDELISFKDKMKPPPIGNVNIKITRQNNIITISGRLIKADTLSHDPNIGAISLICATLRKLGWEGEIIITNHGLQQHHLTQDNKFVRIANMLNIKLEGLVLPTVNNNIPYWRYEKNSEKLGTIFIHIVVENFSNGKSIFENHAGSEKGYFITAEGKPIPLAKYTNRFLYKAGYKSEIIHIPDLILIDFGRSEIINVEGKKYEYRAMAIEDLKDYDDIERLYISKYYPKYKIIRTVVLYGGHERKVIELEVGFLLTEDGFLCLGIRPPEIFKDAIKNLLYFWFKQ